MRLGKKLLALICTAALLLSMVGTAFAVETDTGYTLTKEDCFFTVDPESRAVTITSIKETAYENRLHIIVPPTLDGNPVTVFGGGSSVFAGSGWYLDKVTLPEGVTTIGVSAFSNCSDMTAVVLPGTLETIADRAFDGCFDLVDLTFPQGLTSIGKEAFDGTALPVLNLPSSVTSLGASAFSGSKITRIDSLGGVSELPDYLFSGCNQLAGVSLPDTITKLGTGVFFNCAGLRRAELPSSITEIPSSTFCFRGSSSLASSLTEVVLPSTITVIGNSAFEGNSMLEHITLPAGLTTLGTSVFRDCRALTSIDLPDGIETLGINTFEFCWSLQSVKLPAQLKTVGSYAFEQCRALQSLTFPAGLTALSYTAFTYTPALRQVIFQGSAPNVESSNPFYSTSREQPVAVYVPTEHKTGYEAWGRWDTGKVTLEAGKTPADVTSVGTTTTLSAVLEVSPQDKLILWCTVDVTPKTHPDDLSLIPSGAISYKLGDSTAAPPIHFVGGNTSTHQTIGYDVSSRVGETLTVQASLAGSLGFNGSESNILTGTVIRPTDGKEHPFQPATPPEIKVYETEDDPANPGGLIITKINGEMAERPTPVIPDKIDGKQVTGLGDGLFANNNFTTYVTIPGSVKSLGTGVFENCLYLSVVALPNGITAIPENTFAGCSKRLQVLTLPGSIASIGANAFTGCTALSEITLPASLVALDKSAFSGCALTKVTFDGNAPALTNDEVGEIFDHWTILYTKQGAMGFDKEPWASMRREPVALSISFDPKAVSFPQESITDNGFTMLIPVTFDKSAPAPDLSKVEVSVYGWAMNGVTVIDGKLSVPVDKKYFAASPFVRIAYPGDWNYKSAEYIVSNVVMPSPKLASAITAVDSKFTTEANGTIKLWISPTVTPTNYYGQGYRPSLENMEVKLGETVCRTGMEDGLLYAVVEDSLASTSQRLTVTFKGDTRFAQSPPFDVGDVVIPGPAPVIRLTAAMGTVIWDGANYILPLTVDLSVRYPGAGGAPDRSKLSVTLGGTAATSTPGDGNLLNVVVPKEKLSSPMDVAVHYEGEPASSYPAKDFILQSVTLADPAASTTLDATAGTLTEDGDAYCLPIEVTLTNEPYAGTEEKPNRGEITITIEGENATYTVGTGDVLNVLVDSKFFYSTVDIVVTYPGEARFKSSSKTLTGVKIPDPDPQPVATTLVAAVDGFAWSMSPGWGHCLVLNVDIQHAPYHGNETLSANRDLITVALGSDAVAEENLHWSGGKLYIPVGEPLYNKTISITLSYPGEAGYFLASEQVIENVLIADPGTLLVATTLTAEAGALTKDSDDTYYIPLTVALTANGETEKTPDRAAIVVKLNGAVVPCDDNGEVFKLPIDDALFPSTTNTVSVEYAGDEWFLPSSKIINNVAIPNPVPAKTTLNFTVDKLLTSLSDSRRVLRLAVTLANDPYWADSSLKPSREAITVTLGGTPAEIVSVTEAAIDIFVPSALLNTATDVVVTYHGDAHFESSTKTVSGVALTDPVTPPTPPTPPSDGGNTGGGGSGGSPSPAPKPSADDNAKVTVSNKDVTDAVKAAAESGSVVLKADTAENAKSVAVTVPASVMKAIAKADAPVSIQSPVADLTLDTKVLEVLQQSGVKDVVVSAGAADTAALPKAAQTALEGRPVYDISITSGGKTVSQFDGGTVTVALPYTPAEGERADSLVACWVKDDGTTETLRNSVYADGKLTFSTSHLSTYAILHKDVAFLDVAEDSWAKGDIGFVVSRGILNGMGDNGAGGQLFGPGITLTGNMAVVAVARLNGVADGTDAGWAYPALAWAVEKKILPEGFKPDAPITREQFAFLVAGAMGGAKSAQVPTYLDLAQVSSGCTASVSYLTSLGIMNGTGDGYFSPKHTLTRSELAAILHRLMIWQMG